MSRSPYQDRVRGFACLGIVRVLPILLGLCFALAASYSSVAAAQTTVRVGIIQAASDAPFFIAEKKGYFAQEGLKVQFSVLKDMIAPLATGQLDVAGISTSASLFNAVDRGIDIKIVADKGSTPPGYGYQPILVRTDLVTSGKVKSFADFKGLKIAGFNNGSASMSTLSIALAKGGLMLSDVNVVFMPFPQHVLAFANGAIDASITVEPLASEAVRRGAAVRFASDDTIYPDHQLAVVLYSGGFIKGNPEAAKKFMRAYLRGAREYNDALKDGKLAGPNAAEIVAILVEYSSIKNPQMIQAMTPAGINPDGTVNAASLSKDLDFYKSQGLVTGKVHVEQVIDNSFAEAALKDLGPYVKRTK